MLPFALPPLVFSRLALIFVKNTTCADELKNSQVFTMQQFKEVRIKEGQSPDVKMLLSRYCKNGKLERVGRGVYRQVKS